MTHTSRPAIDRARLDRALGGANLPALCMVAYHLTGDRAWLEQPFRPSRGRGLDENVGGGFDDAVAAQIRDEVAEAVLAWHAGRPAALDSPDPETFGEMLECFLGEPVAREYWEMFAVEHGIRPDPTDVGQLRDLAAAACYRVAIIGAGLSGMRAAARLQAAGVPFEIFERSSGVGGVWLQNTYPGAGVDTPSNLYSFNDFPSDWSTQFARRDEMLAYLQRYAMEHGLEEHIRFETTVEECRWDHSAQQWVLTTVHASRGRETTTARAVISAVGLFTEPAIPDIEHLEEFSGVVCHSARWPRELDGTGQRVAVVGSGASAMQVVPAIADRAQQVIVLQRSPQWIAPVAHYFDPIESAEHWLWQHVPFYKAWCRTRTAWNFNDKNYPSLVIDPEWEHSARSVSSLNDFHRKYLTSYIESKLGDDPELLAKAIPNYPPYGKRILLDNGWYDALRKPNVQLEAEGLTDVDATGVITESGRRFDVDTVVLCTGFQTTRYLHPMKVVGRGGVDLRDSWGDDNAVAYLGTSTPACPNLFFMYGPGTNAGGGSFVTLAEAQLRWIMQAIAETLRRGALSIEPRADVTADYNRRFDEGNATMVWSHPGMSNYVRNRAGRVTVNMPWRIVDYWAMTARPSFDDYEFAGAAARAAEAV